MDNQEHVHVWQHYYAELYPNSTGHGDRWNGMECVCGAKIDPDEVESIVNLSTEKDRWLYARLQQNTKQNNPLDHPYKGPDAKT